MLGFLLQWPTILTLTMFPLLVTMYVHLARAKERTTASNSERHTTAMQPSRRGGFHGLAAGTPLVQAEGPKPTAAGGYDWLATLRIYLLASAAGHRASEIAQLPL